MKRCHSGPILLITASLLLLPTTVARAQCEQPQKDLPDLELGPISAPCNVSYCRESSLAWNGAGYGVARRSGDTIYFDRLTAGGTLIGTTAVGTNNPYINVSPRVAWHGTGYAVVWTQTISGSIPYGQLVLLDTDGNPTSAVTSLSTSPARRVELAWDEANVYGIAFWTGGSIQFVRFDLNGNQLGSQQSVTAASGPVNLSLIWNGSGYGIAWSNEEGSVEEYYFTRLGPTGSTIGSTIRLTTPDDRSADGRTGVSLAWNGAGYGVAWKGEIDVPFPEPDENIFFRRLDAFGNPLGSSIMVSPAWSGDCLGPRLAWNGSAYGLIYQDYTTSNYELRLASISAAGNVVDNQRVTDTPEDSESVSLAWNGYGYGWIWQEDPVAGSGDPVRLMFSRAGCCNDGDLDLQSTCAGDCDDQDPSIFTGSPQVCDGLNNDCSHPSWPALAGTNEADNDGDAFSACQGDCDDAQPAAFPGNPEICDGLDNDCSGVADDGLSTDGDGDGWFADGSCSGPIDCDDANPSLQVGNTCTSPDPVQHSDGVVDLTFPNVTAGGDTTISESACDPLLLDGIVLTSPCTPCIDVQTDAEWEGLVEVCIHYDDSCMTPLLEQNLKMITCDGISQQSCELLQFPSLDTTQNVICASTSHFSYFAIGQLTDTDGDFVEDLIDNCPEVWNLTQNDQDADGRGDVCDCGPADGTIWSAPGEVRQLTVALDPQTGHAILSWLAPYEAGGVQPAYDSIRSSDAADFLLTGECIESNDSADTNAVDVTDTPLGGGSFYLVRAETSCPDGQGPLGVTSFDEPRSAPDCP